MKPGEANKKRRPLRTENLIVAAETALAEMIKFPPEVEPVNVSSLAKKLGVSRQAIYNNKLAGTIEKYEKWQHENFSNGSSSVRNRRSADERIADLKEQNEDLQKHLDGWIELWATIEYNAKIHGFDMDLLLMPLALPQRKTLIFKK